VKLNREERLARQGHGQSVRRRTVAHSKVAATWINAAVEDAEAHGRQAMLQLRSDPSGFLSLASSGPLGTANRRLDNLGRTLRIIVQKARIAFYINSHELYRPYLMPAYHQMDVHPTKEGAIAARDALIHGRSLDGDILHALGAAKFSLRVAIQSDGGDAALRRWGDTTRNQLQARTDGWLSDASHAIHAAVGWSMLRPEVRPSLERKKK
jgi:hypothetical protein